MGFDEWFKEVVAINNKGQHFPIDKYHLKMAYNAGYEEANTKNSKKTREE